MLITDPKSIRRAYYNPAWISLNGDGSAVVEIKLTTGATLKISVKTDALPDNPDTARELTACEAISILTANSKEGN